MADIKLKIEKLPGEKATSRIFDELRGYCKILKAKYGIQYNLTLGPFTTTLEEVKHLK